LTIIKKAAPNNILICPPVNLVGTWGEFREGIFEEILEDSDDALVDCKVDGDEEGHIRCPEEG